MSEATSPAAVDLAARLPRELVAELLALGCSSGAEFAEVYGERSVRASCLLEEDRLKSSEYSVIQGVGIRAIRGDQTGYAYADGFAPEDLREAARVAARIARDGSGDGHVKAFRVVDPP